jgi:MacB-like periplasmic core domain/FtsX-like permease family
VSVNGEPPSPENRRAVLFYTWVQPNYFETLGIPLSSGHGFQGQAGEPEHTAILSVSAARRLWPGQNPIGRTLRLGTDDQYHVKSDLLPDGPTWEVVGIARDTRGGALDGSDAEQVYVPLPADRVPDYPILVRTIADPTQLMRAMEPVLAAVDPNVAASLATLQDMLHETDAFLAASLSAAIASTISLFGLLLASMGIYSTVSYMVVLRTHEVGIRMAIGADKRDILVLMMRGSSRPVLAGLLAGMLLATGVARLLRGVLYGLSTIDVIAFAGAALLFLAIALVATWLPSRRAMRVDPLVALRYS